MTDIIIIAVVVVIIGVAVAYIVREKKHGKCIGCPNGSTCSGKCGEGGCSGCGEHK